MRPLAETGKPMRALHALCDTSPAEPLTEYGVFLVARSGILDTSAWHGALKALVARGLAERCGRRGGYEWYITDAGRDALAAADERRKGTPDA